MTVIDTVPDETELTDQAEASEATEETEETETEEAKAGTGTMGRGDRGYLEALVKEVTDLYVQDKIILEAGQVLTPHRIARIIDQNLKDKGIEHKPMSAGSVDATLKRWVDYGFMIPTPKPFGFARYTEDALAPRGLSWCKARYTELQKPTREAKRAERKAAKEVAASAEPQQADTVEAAPVAETAANTEVSYTEM